MADANRILTKRSSKDLLAKSGRDLVIDVDRFAVDLSPVNLKEYEKTS